MAAVLPAFSGPRALSRDVAAKAGRHHDLDSRIGARLLTSHAACLGAATGFLGRVGAGSARRIPALARGAKGYSMKSA